MSEYRARLRERQNEQLPRMMRLCALAHPDYTIGACCGSEG